MVHVRLVRRIVQILVVAASVPAPAFAQVDLSGGWAAKHHQDWQERIPGPEVVDLTGLPVNDEGRAKALSYQASQLSLPERQCQPYSPAYLPIGPHSIRMWADFENGTLVAWNISTAGDRAGMKIWMDGRPHPSQYALHTFGGFTTGTWEGDVLTTYTTHMKAWLIRRNGVPHSDDAAITMHLIRHGNLLTINTQIDDPVYLTRPYVITRTYELDPKSNIVAIPLTVCSPEAEIARLDGTGIVPHHLPDQNPFVDELTRVHHIPQAATLGGAATAYPEFRKTIKDGYVLPDVCVRYCCGWAADPVQEANTRRSLPDCPTFAGGDVFNAPNDPGQQAPPPPLGQRAPQPAAPAPVQRDPQPASPAPGRR